MSYRSEPLKLCQIIVQKDAAFSCVVELGQQKLVQFKDLNHEMSVFQRTYVGEVRRCTELERCIQYSGYIEKEIVDGGAVNHIPPITVSNTEMSPQREMYDLETRLYDLERDIRQFLQNEAQLKRNFNDLKQCKSVYEKVEAFFRVHIENTAKTELGNDIVEVNDVGTPLTPLMEQHESPWFIAGTIDTQKRHSFERVLWRACRRTAFVRTAEIENYFEDPDTGKLISKSVFIIFFNGSKLHDIVNRVCDGFSAKQYSCPKTSKERQLALADILIRLHDLNLVIQTTEKHKLELLRGAAFELPEWVRQVHLQKCVFHTLNLFTFDHSGNFSIAECWILERKMDTVLQCLQRGVKRKFKEKAGGTFRPIMKILETDEPHPTYNRTTKFTRVFQDVVDSYGIASYREINPACFATISFPFLFAIMFGDFGHGIILLMAGLAFLYYEKKILGMRIKNEIITMFFNGRYMIVCMGLFSIYVGLIYNDAFAKSVNIFGSKWKNPLNVTHLTQLYNRSVIMKHEGFISFDPKDAYIREEGAYPIGLDPVWNFAVNRLNFVNSLKMKLSVIFGILQMLLGTILCFLNARFFRSAVNMFTIAIPQIIFLSAIFVYFCILIFAKWIFFSVWPEEVFGYYYPGSSCAPSLLMGLINMFMLKTRNDGFMKPNTMEKYPNCHINTWYPHQTAVERTLVIIALCCVPIMFFGKPLTKALKREHKPILRKQSTRRLNKSKNINIDVHIELEKTELIVNDRNEFGINGTNDDMKNKSKQPEQGAYACADEEDMKIVDLMVHQAIHTIEFVLGCVSHTASYLRLWALSLAHSQLAEVLWHMVLVPSFSVSGTFAPIAIFISVFIFSILTVTVLVLMEGLSAFLHTLRLHWVEFQSKFYEGAGIPFIAFCLRASLEKLCAESNHY